MILFVVGWLGLRPGGPSPHQGEAHEKQEDAENDDYRAGVHSIWPLDRKETDFTLQQSARRPAEQRRG